MNCPFNSANLLLLFLLLLAPAAHPGFIQQRTVGDTTHYWGSTDDGKPISVQSRNAGNTTYTFGTYGDKPVNATVNTLGGTSYLQGQVGGVPISSATHQLGNQVHSSGLFDKTPFSTTTRQLGNTSFTSGNAGGSAFDITARRVGDTTFISAPAPLQPRFSQPSISQPSIARPGIRNPFQPKPWHNVINRPTGYANPVRTPTPFPTPIHYSNPGLSYGADQPISFHSGVFPQSSLPDMAQIQMRMDAEAAQQQEMVARRKRADEEARQRLSEWQRQHAQEALLRLAFESYLNASDNNDTKTIKAVRKPSDKPRPYRKWFLLFLALMSTIGWLWKHGEKLKKPENQQATKELLSECGTLAWTGLQRGGRWMAQHMGKRAEQPLTAAFGELAWAGLQRGTRWTEERLGQMRKGGVWGKAITFAKNAATHIRRTFKKKWLKTRLAGGPKRTCKVCGTENPAKATACSNCGIVFEQHAQKTEKPKKKTSWLSRKGPYGRLRDNRRNK